MNKKLLITLLIPFVFLHTKAQVWNLVWSDEFTNGSINTSNWLFETGGGGWGNAELENYTNRPDNAIIYNNNLLVIAKKESFGGSNYTSARMITKGLHTWTYGKIEARIKLQQGKGLWPAFWMLGQSISQVGWPQCGEIDIMEHVNANAKINGTIHWDNNGHAQYGGDTIVNSTEYHNYTVEWDANAIKWLLDGNKYWEANIANNINSTDEFHKPFFILLNFAVGGNWPGNPDGTTLFPDTMFVDYVRVYQKSTTGIEEITNRKNPLSVFFDSAGHVILSIHNAETGKYDIEIVDLLGKVYFRRSIFNTNSAIITMPVLSDNIPSGIYIVQVRDREKTSCLKFTK